MKNISLYIHIPFCEKRCSYCDFNTYAGKLNLLPRYIDALNAEIRKVVEQDDVDRQVHTLYFGGGTPSLVPAWLYSEILEILYHSFGFTDDIEITLEANPGTLRAEYLQELRKLGFNRISIGMQSAVRSELLMLSRIHSWEDVVQSVLDAKKSGFANINLDLIYGLPGQNLEDWQYNLEKATSLEPDHLSLYALTLEPVVPMFRRILAGELPWQDDDLMADMYEMSRFMLREAGFYHYEISNWARKDAKGDLLVCRHNLQYWRNQPYLGFGAGAHGYAGGVRTENLYRINAYIQRCEQKDAGRFPRGPALRQATLIPRRREMQETVMLALRMADGISRKVFFNRFGCQVEDVFNTELQELINKGLVELADVDGECYKLTERGLFLSNIVFREFVD